MIEADKDFIIESYVFELLCLYFRNILRCCTKGSCLGLVNGSKDIYYEIYKKILEDETPFFTLEKSPWWTSVRYFIVNTLKLSDNQ